jgi:hypothetical protein
MNRFAQKDRGDMIFSKKIVNLLIPFVFFVTVPVLAVLIASSAIADQRLSDELMISDVANETYLPSVAYNWKHREYLVVWHAKWVSGSRDIRAARISEAGQILDTFTVYKDLNKDSVQPSVDYDPVNDRYLVAWIFDYFGNGSDRDLYGRFIPWDGPSASLNEFAICSWTTHQWNPKVAYGRAVEEFLVVWMNEYQAGTLPMYISGRRIKAADGSFFSSGSDFTISHGTEQRVNPDVTYNQARNEYLVVYDNTADIFGMRLTGTVIDNFGGEFRIAGWSATEIRPAVAACKGADQYLVTWQSNQGTGNNAIYARFISGGGTLGNVYVIDDSTGQEQEADVACNLSGTEYFITWETEYAGGYYGVWGRLVQPNETLKPAFSIVHASWTLNRTNPAAAGGRSSYMVAWEHEYDGGASILQGIHGRLVFRRAGFPPAVYELLLQ